MFVGLQEAFRDVWILGNELWKRHKPFAPSAAGLLQPPANALEGWRGFAGLLAVQVLGLDESSGGSRGPSQG